MARFEVKGTDELARALDDLGGRTGDLARSMIAVGASKMLASWVDKIKEHGHVDTGAMWKSVKSGKVKNDGVLSVETYPQGKDKKGVRNAEKAFILHYGWKGKAGSHFVDEVEEQGGEEAVQAMEDFMGTFIDMKMRGGQ